LTPFYDIQPRCNRETDAHEIPGGKGSLAEEVVAVILSPYFADFLWAGDECEQVKE
jgi:hypothetical protein